MEGRGAGGARVGALGVVRREGAQKGAGKGRGRERMEGAQKGAGKGPREEKGSRAGKVLNF